MFCRRFKSGLKFFRLSRVSFTFAGIVALRCCLLFAAGDAGKCDFSKLSAPETLAYVIFYSGADDDVFKKLVNNYSVEFHQEFGGFIGNRSLFDGDLSHRDLNKARQACRALIDSEKAKENPDWTLLRDCNIILASLIIKASGEEQSNEEFALLNKIVRENMPNLNEYPHSDRAFAHAFYAYLMYSGISLEKDFKRASEIVSRKEILPYWINFYLGYIFPQDKDFALVILRENAKNKNLSALQNLCDIYAGLFNEGEKDEENFKFYKARYDEALREYKLKKFSERKKYLDENIKYLELLSKEDKAKDAARNRYKITSCLKILSDEKIFLFERDLNGEDIYMENLNRDLALFKNLKESVKKSGDENLKRLLKRELKV